MTSIGRDDKVYHCFECGHTWSAKPVWLFWPLEFKWYWRRPWRIGTHGWEVGCKNFGQKVFATVVTVGPLRIIMGANYQSPIVYHAGKWLKREMLEGMDPFDRELSGMGL